MQAPNVIAAAERHLNFRLSSSERFRSIVFDSLRGLALCVGLLLLRLRPVRLVR